MFTCSRLLHFIWLSTLHQGKPTTNQPIDETNKGYINSIDEPLRQLIDATHARTQQFRNPLNQILIYTRFSVFPSNHSSASLASASRCPNHSQSNSIRSKPHTNSKKPGKSQWSQDPPRWYYSPNKAPFVLCEKKHSRDDGVHNLQKDRRWYAIVTHVSNDVTSLTVKFLNEHFDTKNYHTGIDLGKRLQNCVKNKSKKRLHDELPIKTTFPILIPLSL